MCYPRWQSYTHHSANRASNFSHNVNVLIIKIKFGIFLPMEGSCFVFHRDCRCYAEYWRTMTKGPNWHVSIESLPTIPFTYKAWVWMTRQMSLQRPWQRMIIVCLPPWLTDSNADHFYWSLNLPCNRPLCKWYSWKRHKEAMSVGSFCHGMAEKP